MSSPALWPALALVAGLALPAQQQKWKPLYDYTHLPPDNETFWAPLSKTQVQMEQAIELAAETEGAPIRVLKAELKTGEGDTTGGDDKTGGGDAVWQLDVFVGGADGAPKRVNLRVSVAESKVLHRIELLSLAKDEEQAWTVLSKAEVPAEVAIQLSKNRSAGDKADAIIDDPRVRTLEFVPEPNAPIWRIELMGYETKKEVVRRYEFHVNARKPVVRQKLMLDRFAGEPLRRDKPVELPNGMYLHDFITGDGAEVTVDSKVKVNYRLFLIDNTKLHDTWQTKRPETFVVSGAPLKGMTQGMVGMRVGGKRKIAMPYDLAFGEKGNEICPPKAMVVCDVAVEALASN